MKFVLKVLAFFLLLIVLSGLGLYFSLPTEKEISGCITTKMYGVHLCPGSKDYVPIKSISRYMQRAVILTEDGNFFSHHGFDWESIEKNAKENIEKGAYKRGGSTITQQLAKNMFLSKEKTLWRKGIEALITYRLEKYLSKKQILERYLNVVEFGKEIYGIKAAANYYFKKSPSELGILEAAFLAMVLPSPEKYSRSYYKKQLTPFAQRRISRIVSDMWKSGLIGEEDYHKAVNDMNWFFGSPPPPPPDGSEGEEVIGDDSYDQLEKEHIRKLQFPSDDESVDEPTIQSSDSPTTNHDGDDD